jgi:[ribosomal protein S18]-alanine N-acetyltransferase
MIREMIERDLDAVAAIEAECIKQPWSRKSFAESLTKDYSLFLVEESEGKICGYIGIYLTYEDAEITGIAVLPEKRRCGIGKKLLLSAAERIVERSTQRILLEVRESNEAARAFYLELGFHEIGIRRNFYDFPQENAVLMQLELKE